MVSYSNGDWLEDELDVPAVLRIALTLYLCAVRGRRRSGAPFVPRPSDHGAEMKAHADPDQPGQEDHHHADGPVVVVAGHDLSREQE